MWDLCLSVLQVRHQGSELVHVKDVSATSDAVCECDAVRRRAVRALLRSSLAALSSPTSCQELCLRLPCMTAALRLHGQA